jgi:hypothetical protein
MAESRSLVLRLPLMGNGGLSEPAGVRITGYGPANGKVEMRLLNLVTAHSKSGDIPVVRILFEIPLDWQLQRIVPAG